MSGIVTIKSKVNFCIDLPEENQVIASPSFQLQGWITLEEYVETDYFFTDGKKDILLQAVDRPDVKAAFPDKHIFAFTQTIDTLELDKNAYCFIRFKGQEKEHRLLVPIRLS